MNRNPHEGSRRPVKKKLLENGNLQVSIPIKFRGIGSRHKIVYPGEVNEAPVIVALARAFRWQKYIDEGRILAIRPPRTLVGTFEMNREKLENAYRFSYIFAQDKLEKIKDFLK